MSLGMRRGPRVVASGEAVCITAIGGKQGKGRDGDLLAMHSADGGKTWKQIDKGDYNAVQAKGSRSIWAVGPKGMVAKMK